MRRSLAVCRAGLSAAAALVLLTACGGSDDEDAASTSSSSSASETSEPSGADEADPVFCAAATDLLAQVTPVLIGSPDPAGLAPVLEQAATDARAVEPPESIATDWAALTGGLDQLATSAAAVNPDDPTTAAQFLQLKAQLLGQLGGAAANVQAYLAQSCDLTLPTDSASPSS